MTVQRSLGRGWVFPVHANERRGSLGYEQGTEKIRQSIQIILDTEPGERIMRPTFGCGLRRYLMQPNTAATRALIQHDVQRALTTWEPRIRLDAVAVEPGDDPALVWIRIDYAHQRDNRKDNLVYPFYLQ